MQLNPLCYAEFSDINPLRRSAAFKITEFWPLNKVEKALSDRKEVLCCSEAQKIAQWKNKLFFLSPIKRHERFSRMRLLSYGDVTRDDFSARQRYNIVAILFRMTTTLFQHLNLCYAKNRPCESSCVTSPLRYSTDFEKKPTFLQSSLTSNKQLTPLSYRGH